jgi:hypothetical protein
MNIDNLNKETLQHIITVLENERRLFRDTIKGPRGGICNHDRATLHGIGYSIQVIKDVLTKIENDHSTAL